jgi:hypothetical protein
MGGACAALLVVGQRFLIQRSLRPKEYDWVGLYNSPTTEFSLWIIQGQALPTQLRFS